MNQKDSRRQAYEFTLYVAGDSPNSVRATNNLAALCRTHLQGCYQVTIVDIFVHPMRAIEAGIAATPTLVRVHPGPARVIIGDLSDTSAVLGALDLPGAAFAFSR
jgi:circadian clock protein KaiB